MKSNSGAAKSSVTKCLIFFIRRCSDDSVQVLCIFDYLFGAGSSKTKKKTNYYCIPGPHACNFEQRDLIAELFLAAVK